MKQIEIVPAILRKNLEGIREDWYQVVKVASHVQIDITDGVFAGDGTFREISEFKKLPESEKIELHMMVHDPAVYMESIIDLNPARCVFHIEAFADGGHLDMTYKKLRQETTSELGLAINPSSPNKWLEEQIALIDYVLFMGYQPGFAGQSIDPKVYVKIGQFIEMHPDMNVEVDGQVNPDTISDYVKAGANILCANSSVFEGGDPEENLRQLKLLALEARG